MAMTNMKGEMRERSDRSREAGMDKDGDERGRRGGFHRKKVCRFCSDQDFIMDYKDSRMMASFVTEHGKIVPRRITALTSKQQRLLVRAIKRARHSGLLAFQVG